MKASDLRQNTEEILMSPIYDELRKAKLGGASFIQVSQISPEQKRILERDGFTITTFTENNRREQWFVTRISWME
jgi:hypothetical protein